MTFRDDWYTIYVPRVRTKRVKYCICTLYIYLSPFLVFDTSQNILVSSPYVARSIDVVLWSQYEKVSTRVFVRLVYRGGVSEMLHQKGEKKPKKSHHARVHDVQD